MRTLLSLVAAASIATATVHVPTADACGGSYGEFVSAPQSFTVSTHFIPDHKAGGRSRTFVLLDGTAPANTQWSQLAPRSYDSTKIANAPQGPTRTFTLLNEKGRRVVTGSKYFYLTQTFDLDRQTSLAIEVDVPDAQYREFELALDGKQHRGTFGVLAERATTDADAEWVRSRGFAQATAQNTPVRSVGAYEILTTYGHRDHVALVRHDGRELLRASGWVKGSLVFGGSRYLVVERQGKSSLVAI